MMKRLTPIIFVAVLTLSAFAQNPEPAQMAAIQTVTVASKGQDVRSVLADVFGQAKKSFVVEPNIHFALYLSLNDMEFEEALGLILKTAQLKYQLQNGIYFISREKAGSPSNPVNGSTGKLDPTLLRKQLTVNFHKTDIRSLFTELTNQTGVMIDVDASVPNYKVDAVLKNVTLKYALQNICRPAGLTYRFTPNWSLLIVKAAKPAAATTISAPNQ